MYRYDSQQTEHGSALVQCNVLGIEAAPIQQELCHNGELLPCAFCGSAYRMNDGGCQNPGCPACVHISPQAAETMLANSSKSRRAEYKRKSEAAAMARFHQRGADRREQQLQQALQEVKDAGQCNLCFWRSGKRIKHRSHCPAEAA